MTLTVEAQTGNPQQARQGRTHKHWVPYNTLTTQHNTLAACTIWKSQSLPLCWLVYSCQQYRQLRAVWLCVWGRGKCPRRLPRLKSPRPTPTPRIPILLYFNVLLISPIWTYTRLYYFPLHSTCLFPVTSPSVATGSTPVLQLSTESAQFKEVKKSWAFCFVIHERQRLELWMNIEGVWGLKMTQAPRPSANDQLEIPQVLSHVLKLLNNKRLS